jgi:hypothetical protein
MAEVEGFALFFQQLRAILWKAFLVRKRHWISTLLEVLYPLVITLITSFQLYNAFTDPEGINSGSKPAEIHNNPFFWIPFDLIGVTGSNVCLYYAPNTLAQKRIIDRMKDILDETRGFNREYEIDRKEQLM